MTGIDLIVTVPWILLGACLAVAWLRLRTSRRFRRDPPAPGSQRPGSQRPGEDPGSRSTALTPTGHSACHDDHKAASS
ncbi:MAG: hypothetical protein ACLQFR_31265 [Streptosporangiaceae bacterium]